MEVLGVVATLKTHNDIGLTGKIVRDLTLALVPPIRSNDCCD